MGFVIVTGLVGVAALLVFMPAIIRADTRRRRRKDPRYRPLGSLGIVDEIFQPTTYSAWEQLEAEQELPAPAPAPGDPLGSAARRRASKRVR